MRIYGSDIDHGMSNFLLRLAPDFSSLMMPPFLGDDKRVVDTESEESGFNVAIDFPLAGGTFVLGVEGKDASHDAVVNDPDFAPFFVTNFNDVDVDSLAYYGQWSTTLNDRLYRIMPNNLRLSAFYETATFQAKFEQVWTADQDNISATNTNDPTNPNNSFAGTDGHALSNVYLTWVLDNNWIVSAGAENLLDDDYIDHLSGFNRVLMSTVPRGSRMFGHGRNFFGRVQYEW